MSNTAIGKIVILCLTGMLVGILIFSDFGNQSRVKVYDCGMAEWHPDIPVAVKEECRKLKREQSKEISPPTFQRQIQT